MKQPNILLILCDQFRGDCLSYKGHPDVLTPNLDHLAAEGLSFDHTYSAVPSCVPARAMLFTGQDPVHNKRVGYVDGEPWRYENMLAEVLAKAGYRTQCVGKMHVDPPRNNCGFHNVKLHDGYLSYYRNKSLPYYLQQETHDDYLYFLKNKKGLAADVTQTGIDPNSRMAYPWPYEEELHPTNWCTTESIRFLETRDREQPFFLMASYVRPHQPFDAPAAYHEIYRDKKLRAPFVGEWETGENTRKYSNFKDSVFGTVHEESKDRAMKGYYANITHVDSQIGRLLMAFQEDGSYEDTVIIFSSDHGELLFDHNLYRKAFPYQGSVQIPLIVRVGRNVGTGAHGASESLVSLTDFLPTMAELAGADIPEGVDGRSLVPELMGNETAGRDYIHGEHGFGHQMSNQYIVTATDKFVWYSETNVEQYFDLLRDPHELVNRVEEPDKQERVAELRRLLIEELTGRPEGFVSDGSLQATGQIVDLLP